MDTGIGIAFMDHQTRPLWFFDYIGDCWTRAYSDVIKPIIGRRLKLTHSSLIYDIDGLNLSLFLIGLERLDTLFINSEYNRGEYIEFNGYRNKFRIM